MLSHVFCYVDVVTQEHPIAGKRSDIDLINSTHSSVLEISQLSHLVLLFTVNDVSEPTISTLFPFTTLGVCPICFCVGVCVYVSWVTISWSRNISYSLYFNFPTCLPDWIVRCVIVKTNVPLSLPACFRKSRL